MPTWHAQLLEVIERHQSERTDKAITICFQDSGRIKLSDSGRQDEEESRQDTIHFGLIVRVVCFSETLHESHAFSRTHFATTFMSMSSPLTKQ
jgi:hypothetical protein